MTKPRFKTREDLYKYVMTSKEYNWHQYDDWVLGLAIPAHEFHKPLYHLSHDNNLAKKWIAKDSFDNGEGSQPAPHPLWAEFLPPRVSTSLTIEGCYYGSYPRIDRAWANTNDGYLDMFVYEMDYTDCWLIPHDILTREWLVYDAHATKEVCIFGQPVAKLHSKVRIKDNSYIHSKDGINIRPYDCKKYDEIFIATPLEIIEGG